MKKEIQKRMINGVEKIVVLEVVDEIDPTILKENRDNLNVEIAEIDNELDKLSIRRKKKQERRDLYNSYLKGVMPDDDDINIDIEVDENNKEENNINETPNEDTPVEKQVRHEVINENVDNKKHTTPAYEAIPNKNRLFNNSRFNNKFRKR